MAAVDKTDLDVTDNTKAGTAGETEGEGESRDDAISSRAADLAAKRSIAPLNMHQATVYFCCAKTDAPLWQKLFFMSTTYVLVAFQIAVCMAVMSGIERNSCVDNSMCKDSEVCFKDEHACLPCRNYLRDPGYFATKHYNSTHLQVRREVTDRYTPCMLGYKDPLPGLISGTTQYNRETGEWATGRKDYYDNCFLKADNNITEMLRPCKSSSDSPYRCDHCKGAGEHHEEYGRPEDDPDCEKACDWQRSPCATYKITVTDPSWVCPHGDYICHKCFDPEERTFWYGQDIASGRAADVVEAMRLGDWYSLILVSVIIAASATAELRE
eukprot:SAG31_NODE_3919_length_3751_cov_4.492607_4_plen_326_part_00